MAAESPIDSTTSCSTVAGTAGASEGGATATGWHDYLILFIDQHHL